jgi:hypothetical protein
MKGGVPLLNAEELAQAREAARRAAAVLHWLTPQSQVG